MSVNLGDPLLPNISRSNVTQHSNAGMVGNPIKRGRPGMSKASSRQIQMFLHGGESSLVTEEGDYNIQRMVPQFVKYYLNWTRDTFPSIVRLPWGSLMLLFVGVKLVTIAVFGLIIMLLDAYYGGQCVTGASSYDDFFFFVVHTIFTIGFGSMSPVCDWSNVMVTVISFFGMFQTATFTGIFFAKFSMDPRRNYACAFSTKLVGIPPLAVDEEGGDDLVRLNFRFVNAFHRRYFKVSCRLYLIEHRMNAITEQWLTPVVEELRYFDSSAPLEFMSLPIEMCLYIPFSRLVKHHPVSLGSPAFSPVSTPGHRRSVEGIEKRHRHSYEWIRHYSRNGWTGSHANLGAGTPPIHTTGAEPDMSIMSEFEVMCMLVFTDGTTGCDVAVRKSWALADSVWLSQSESSVKWRNIIHRDDKSDQYLVDVAGLDLIDNMPEALLKPVVEEAPASLAPSPSSRDIAYTLINTMTLPARGVGTRLAQTEELFPQNPHQVV